MPLCLHRGALGALGALGFCVVMACSASPVGPSAPPIERTSDLGVRGRAAAMVEPGEWISGQIFILGIEAASAEAWACRDEKDAVHTHLRAESTGLLAWIKRAYMEQDTKLGFDGVFPRRNWADVQIGEKQRRYDVRFRTGRYEYEYRRNYGPMKVNTIGLAPDERAHDLLSAVLMLRAWRPAPGTRGRFGAVLGRWLWRTEVVFEGPDVVLREDGPYPATKIIGTTQKQHPDPKKRVEYDFELWFSDDSARIPLRAKSGSELGDIWLELTDYRSDRDLGCQPHQRIFDIAD
jgi:hypothetical protein